MKSITGFVAALAAATALSVSPAMAGGVDADLEEEEVVLLPPPEPTGPFVGSLGGSGAIIGVAAVAIAIAAIASGSTTECPGGVCPQQ